MIDQSDMEKPMFKQVTTKFGHDHDSERPLSSDNYLDSEQSILSLKSIVKKQISKTDQCNNQPEIYISQRQSSDI